MMLRAAKSLALCAAVLAIAGNARSTEVVSSNDEFLIVHDYSNISIAETQAKTTRLYIGDDQFVVAALPAADQDEVRAIAIEGLKSKVQLVPRKQDANLIAQVRMDRTMNLGIRNPKRVPAHGLVMLSICNYPIAATIAGDCDNLTYFYFTDAKAGDIFRTVFGKWLNSKFPAAAK